MKEFRLCFVPLFVAVDAIGVLPAFRSLSQDMEPRQVRPAIFRFAGGIGRVLGRVGEKIVSKVAMLLLAAIAVMMVRRASRNS